jgi:hypothetical protein
MRKERNSTKQQFMAHPVFLLPLVLSMVAHVQSSADVRLLDAAGSVSNVGLLQVRMDADFGTVCGANAASADVMLARATTCMSWMRENVCLVCMCLLPSHLYLSR